MQNVWGALQWIAANPHRHPLLALIGASVLTVYPDWMHVKYLGTDQYLLGSVLKLMVFHLLPGCTVDFGCILDKSSIDVL